MTRQVKRKSFPTKAEPLYRLGEAEEAVATLLAQGMEMPAKPRHAVPELPEDPTALSDSALMSQFSATMAWAEYQSVQLAAAMVSERYAEEALGKYRAIATVMHADEDAKMTATVAKAKALQDPAYLEANEKMHQAYSYRKMVEAIYNNTERKAAVLSREITRRVGRHDRENRSNR